MNTQESYVNIVTLTLAMNLGQRMAIWYLWLRLSYVSWLTLYRL